MLRFICIHILWIPLVVSDSKETMSVDEAKATVDYWRKDPYYNAEKYAPDFTTPLSKRILKAPDFVLKKIGDGDKRVYKAYLPSSDELELTREYLDLLPPLYKQVLRDTLIGIYFVEDNFLGSGFADMCFDVEYHAKTFLLINKKTLKFSLQEWINQKEQTCFIEDGNSPYQVHVETSADYLGLFGIMLHETSHCVDYVKRFTPYTDSNSEVFHMIYNNPVIGGDFSAIWKSIIQLDELLVSFPLRSEVTFYGMNEGPKLRLSQAKEVYQQLSRSPFVSLYGTLNWAEDFAEAAMYYHMTQHMNLPYKIQVRKNEQVTYEYEPMKNPNILKRLAFLEKYLY